MESGQATIKIRRGLLGILLLGSVIPISSMVSVHLFFPHLKWVNVTFHALIEIPGSFAAVFLAVLLIFLRRHNPNLSRHIWIAGGLIAMEILTVFHAAFTPNGPFIWLRSTATLFGGFLFSMIWLPERIARSRAVNALPIIIPIATVMFALLSYNLSAYLPYMGTEEKFSLAANAISICGGIFFVAAALFFVSRYQHSGGFDDILFASLSLFFGMTSILFPFTRIWFVDWWLWHLVRLIAYFHILYYIFFIYQQTLIKLQTLSESLELRVSERTAELSQEIGERMEVEAALRESEERYRRLLESVTDYIYTVRVEEGRTTITSHGPGCVAVTGYTPQEYAADPGLWLRMVHEEDRPAVLAQTASILSGEDALPIEHRITHKDGRTRWIKNTSVPRYDRERRIIAYDGLVSDITERKEAEEALRTTNEELSSINRVITSYTNILDPREILERVLVEALKIVGLDEGSICLLASDGTLQLVAHHGTCQVAVCNLADQLLRIGECVYGVCARELKPLILTDREAILRFTGGKNCGADIRFNAAFPLVTPRRKCVGMLCVFTITDRKPTVQRLRLLETVTAHVALLIEAAQLYEETLFYSATLEKKVTERTMELAEANRRLTELDRLKSLFIASMSHELRTPLNSVIGFSSILLNEWVGPVNAEQKENLAAVLRAGKYLLALINDVIDVSKIEAGQIEIQLEDFDLRDLIAESVTAMGGEIRDKGLDLRVECGNHMICSDRRRLQQCLFNLLSNAIKYTEKGYVKITVRRASGLEFQALGNSRLKSPSLNQMPDGEFVEISVEESGIGISEEDSAKIFKPFVRLESPLMAKVYGTGLGLYLTRKLVTEVLGGDITFASEFGIGSRFSMLIPVTLNGNRGA